MKILQIGMGNVAGGLEAFVMNYYRVLVHMDIQFDFVCMYDKIAYEEEIRKLGGRIYYIPNVKKNYQGYIKELKKILKETKNLSYLKCNKDDDIEKKEKLLCYL